LGLLLLIAGMLANFVDKNKTSISTICKPLNK